MTDDKSTARLEAFSDGVFAIALTLLILDIRLPSAESLETTADVWRALRHLGPSVFAFLLSFSIIFITWVNHHGALKSVHRLCASFIYANGFLLLTVVFIPFPTALLGEFVWTDHAAPAVVLYNAVLALQAIGWLLMIHTSLHNDLIADGEGMRAAKQNRRNGYFALAFYSLLAIAALWVPVAVAVVTTASWIIWLMIGIRLKHST